MVSLVNGLTVWVTAYDSRRVATSITSPLSLSSPSTPADTCIDFTELEAKYPSPLQANEATSPKTPHEASASLRDCSLEIVQRTLEKHNGNISKAARELRVSRGLIYRRLTATANVSLSVDPSESGSRRD
ncbi:hypothetical protein H0484_13395 [Pusillimonas sp. CC-YST705]|uniref:DNA binding HTH domain-containing protein n=1 Tax=Mesopusillimonas faecipullorum TaxID=2755040 RepID=A0ABS8CFB8_9BURK|nr:hypothetical protein [Mesopusillimonas faecipullorum]